MSRCSVPRNRTQTEPSYFDFGAAQWKSSFASDEHFPACASTPSLPQRGCRPNKISSHQAMNSRCPQLKACMEFRRLDNIAHTCTHKHTPFAGHEWILRLIATATFFFSLHCTNIKVSPKDMNIPSYIHSCLPRCTHVRAHTHTHACAHICMASKNLSQPVKIHLKHLQINQFPPALTIIRNMFEVMLFIRSEGRGW